jgi:hypothetical protein
MQPTDEQAGKSPSPEARKDLKALVAQALYGCGECGMDHGPARHIEKLIRERERAALERAAKLMEDNSFLSDEAAKAIRAMFGRG